MNDDWYKREGAGRKSGREKTAVKEINEIAEANNIELQTITTKDDLFDLHDELTSKYDLPSDSSPEDSSDEPAKPNEKSLDKSNGEKVEPNDHSETDDHSNKPEPPSSSSDQNFTNGDDFDQIIKKFEVVEPHHPFEGAFPEDDIWKATQMDDLQTSNQAITEPNQSESKDVAPVRKTPWEKRASASSGGNTKEKIAALKENAPSSSNEIPSSDQPESPSSEESKEKTKLAKSTNKKATRMLARNASKLTIWLVETITQHFSKIPEKFLDQLEEKGVIDRHMSIEEKGITIAQYIEQHNENIEDLLQVDEETRDDFEEALLLVAEKHEIEVTPEQNLAMVTFTMIISLAKIGREQKKETKRLIKKMSDNYTLGVKKLKEKEEEIASKDEEIRRLKAELSGNTEVDDKEKKEEIRTIQFTSEDENPDKEITPRKNIEADDIVSEVNSIASDSDKEKDD